MIKHVWFDLSGTLTELNTETHDQLRYSTYAKLAGKEVDENLKQEFQTLLKKEGSNAAVFKSLGQPGEFWGKVVEDSDVSDLYYIKDPGIPSVLEKLKNLVPISLFTNIRAAKVLLSVGINPDWFTHIIQAGDVNAPKPSTEGFNKIIDITKIPANEILFVGDSVIKDIMPAKQVGLKTCLVWDKSSEADYSLDKLSDILNLFVV